MGIKLKGVLSTVFITFILSSQVFAESYMLNDKYGINSYILLPGEHLIAMDEIDEVINEAKKDVDDAVNDIDQTINIDNDEEEKDNDDESKPTGLTTGDVSFKSYKDANLVKSNFAKSSMTNVDFKEANLSGADFSFANIANIDFDNANMTDTNFFKANITNADFEESILKNANFAFSNLLNVEFEEVNLTGAILYNTNLTNADYDETNFSNVIIDEAKYNSLFAEMLPASVFKKLSNEEIQALEGYSDDIKNMLIKHNTDNQDVGMLIEKTAE